MNASFISSIFVQLSTWENVAGRRGMVVYAGRHFVHIDKSLTGMEENSEMML